MNGDERSSFGPGDVRFVPAGVVHRFEDFTGDLAVWVLFHGPAPPTWDHEDGGPGVAGSPASCSDGR